MRSSSTSSPDWAALARYLSGESDPGEADTIRQWIAAAPDRPALVDALRTIWAESAVPRDTWDVDAALPRIMRQEVPAVDLASRRRTPSWQRVGRIAVAAAAVAVLAVGATWWRARAARDTTAAAMVAMQEYATQRGQYQTIVLADGTRITLAPMSKLRLPRDFRRSVRDVYLDGQALFKVAHHPTRAFRVHAANAIATDLGTTFVVRSYAGLPQVDVVVTEGVVSLAAQKDSARLHATAPTVLRSGDRGRVDLDGSIEAEHGIDPEAYTAWTEGRLVFRRTPLREVAAELARWYDLQLQLPDSVVAAQRVTVSFDGDAPANVLRFVALSLGLQYEQKGRVVTLAPRKTADRFKP